MKRILFVVAIAMATFYGLHAAQVSEAAARQVADKFFSAHSSQLMAPAAQSSMRLAYKAQDNHFYVFDRGSHGGFVVVAGDDRLPQVLGYGAEGDFSANTLPPSVQYWLDEMNRQIAFLQSHSDVSAHLPSKQATVVEPLVTTQWDQGTPYNNYCPTYGGGTRSAAGCVATAMAQMMNYHQWPAVGRGSHSYSCNVDNNPDNYVELSVDFSQSVYRWDQMLDIYDDSSSEESCDAVAKLMLDVGVSLDMRYGSSSATSGYLVSVALERYFGYSNRSYWLHRDCYAADDWDQFLINEITVNRPVLYIGTTTDTGHAFILDGIDEDGYFHVNWGWSGYYDGYFLVSLLAPTSNMNFRYNQSGLFGLVPETQADAIDDVFYVHSQLWPLAASAPLGSQASFEFDFLTETNMLDTVGYEDWNGGQISYAVIPMKLGVYDINGTELQSQLFTVHNYMEWNIISSSDSLVLDLPRSLEDGEYQIKVFYSVDEGANYDRQVQSYEGGKDLYLKMIVSNDTAYFKDCFLRKAYSVKSIDVPRSIRINKPFNVGVDLSFNASWYEGDGPIGNVYLSMMKEDGVEVATSPLCEVMVHNNEVKNYVMQITAPSEWGPYTLVLKDESGNPMMELDEWLDAIEEVTAPVFVLPICQELLEDFETMTANNSTNDKNVQGRFTTWSFNKSGVRAPGEGKCNGSNAVMMKKPSTVYTAQPLGHNFILAQATFFNPTSTLSKFKLEYSLDGGSTWERAYTIDSLDVAEVPEKSRYLATWNLNLTSDQPAVFRISMIGGGSGANYVDDIALYYNDPSGDVNGDGEVNIADINAIIDIILSGAAGNSAADVNDDGEVNIADINAIIDMILS